MSSELNLTQKLTDLYSQKNYSGFIDELLRSKDQLPESLFHYNLGTAYAKLEKFPIAKFHFEKSIKLGSIEPKILNNLSYVRQKINVFDLDNSSSFIDRFYGILLMIPWEAVFIFFTILVLLLFLKKQLRNKKNVTVLAVIPFLITGIFYAYSSNKNYAIAFEDIEVREGPSEIFEVSNRVPQGAKLLLSEYQNGWFLISRPREYLGWVKKADLAIY
jgi:hypothetical protein